MLNALWALLRAFGGICIFHIAPQDLPRSTTLLAVTTAGNMLLSVIIYGLESSFGQSLFKAVLETAVLYAVTFILLFLLSYGRRWTQTVTALMGCGTLLGAIALTTMLLAPVLPADLGLALLRVNFLLNLLVIAHILRHALGTWFLAGLLIAFGYALLLNKVFMLADALLGTAPA
ncbi:MAG: hypothetical protein IPM80_16365 [Proteobacteria bacterium]|nr:hypothetical protein [Pseudomonadota bacterium]